MNLILHLMKKDLQVARPVWAIWVVVVLIDVAWQTVGARILFESPRPSDGFNLLRNMLPFAELAVGLLLVSQVIHEDPLVDDNAFWLTRPIPPASLFLSKLLTLGLLILGPPLVAEGLLLAWFRVPALYIARVDFEVALALVAPMLFAFVVAAVTSGLPRYVLLLAGILAACALGMSLVTMFAWPAPPGPYQAPLPRFHDPTRRLFVACLFIAGMACVLRWHYRRRDWRGAVALVLVVFGASWLVARLWPGISLFGPEPVLAAGWAAPSTSTLRRADDRLHLAQSFRDRLHIIAAPVVIDSLPADYSATPFTLEGRIEYSDGSHAESGRANPLQVAVGAEYRPSLTLLTDPGPPGSGPTAWESWPVLVHAPTKLLERKVGLPATYRGTFLYRIARHERLASLPLAVDATYVDGPRSLVVRALEPFGSDCRVTLQVNVPVLTFSGPLEPALGFHFRDHRTGQLMRAVHERTGPSAFPTFSMAVSGLAGRYVQVLVEPLGARGRSHRQGPAPAMPDLSARCSDLQLVVVRTTRAGTLTRTLELSDFRLDPSTFVGRR